MNLTSSQFDRDFATHGTALKAKVEAALARQSAKISAFNPLLKKLPQVLPASYDFDRTRIRIGTAQDLSARQSRQLNEVLTGLKPWRKGPFELFGIDIDSEWDSSLKWRRVAPHILPLTGRRILDVGSSNGYYLFRMASANPAFAMGIEPNVTYYYQFQVLQRFLGVPGLFTFPLGLEDLTDLTSCFDTVFCMGMLYHRRSPLDALVQLKSLLAPGGELVLETLIVDAPGETAMFPHDRYARMRNVYFIPTVACLQNWLFRCGYCNIRCVDIAPTTSREQRKTPWIDSDSLETFLDPQDSGLTVEGYPSPVRAVVLARKK